jgi:hypothetical protein
MLLCTEQESSVVIQKGVGRMENMASPTHRIVLVVSQLGFTLALMAVSLSANPASVGDMPAATEPACYALMTDNECHAYRAALASASTPGARDSIKAHFEQLQHDRELTCPCQESHEWVRLKQSPSRITGLTS